MAVEWTEVCRSKGCCARCWKKYGRKVDIITAVGRAVSLKRGAKQTYCGSCLQVFMFKETILR